MRSSDPRPADPSETTDTALTRSYHAPWESAFDKIVTPFEEFLHEETTSGLLLMGCAILALILANTALVHAYEHVLHTPVALNIAGWTLEHSLHHWINDGLMALFFFVMGLEIKREVLVGELSDARRAVLPVLAAIGGMVVPALIYYLTNRGGPAAAAWGVPMATDIAFAVGIMALLGKRVPATLITFLVALAIADDLGAVVVIAIFYTEQIFGTYLLIAGLLFGVLVIFNLSGIRKPLPYFLVGILLWLAMLKSGVHATVAGVLAAMTIPVKPKFNPLRFSLHVRELMDRFDSSCRGDADLLRNEEQRAIVQALENGVHKVESTLQRLEHSMHLPVAFFIVPLFALANAGVPVDFANLGSVVSEPITLGVVVGLLIGKVVGIAGFSLVAVKLGIGELPAGTRPAHIVGVGLVGGIGFTMSIFIAELAFSGQPEQLVMAKTGILMASILAGFGGYLWLRFVAGSPSSPVPGEAGADRAPA
jgi:NhaA family Na+:H+ antiporter